MRGIAVVLLSLVAAGASAAEPTAPIVTPAPGPLPAQSPIPPAIPSPVPSSAGAPFHLTLRPKQKPVPARYVVAIAAGVATALVPVIIGSSLLSLANDQPAGSNDLANGSILLMEAGLALAPVVAHLVAGEKKRALISGIVPMAALLGTGLLMNFVPNVVQDLGVVETRIPFAGLVILSLFSSMIGVIDSFGAADRAHIVVAPTIASNQLGLAVGGVL